MKSSSRSFVPILVVCGAVIGGVLTYLVFSSIARLGAEGVPKPPKNWSSAAPDQARVIPEIQDDSDLYHPASSTSASAYRKSDIPVNWISPVELKRDEIFKIFSGVSSDTVKLKRIIDVKDISYDTNPPPADLQDEYQQFVGIEKVWKQGDVIDGELKGASVYLVRLLGWNMGPGEYIYQIVISADGKSLYVSPGANEDPSYPTTSIGVSTLPTDLQSVHLSGTTPRSKLSVNGRVFNLTSPVMRRNEYIFDTTYGHNLLGKNPVVVSDEGVALYETYSGCLAALLDSGLVVNYTSVIGPQNGFDPKTGSALGIDWDAGYQNSTKYLGKVFGGCGGGYCANVVSSTLVGSETNLVAVGKVRSTGDVLYAPKDLSQHPLVKQAYEMWYDPTFVQKPTIEEMLNQIKLPIFFWKDPIGRWVEYGAEQLIPQAECGKPVIYLYPEMQTDVRVALPRFINVTVSDPVYPKKGWSVTAKPNGDLISKADGKTYGSLYWEGTGVGYQPPTTGFVVSKYSVTTTLMSLLTKYGLNQKESFEFMNFWIPKFAETNAPYFRISFLTNEWSKAAPLSVTPVPKTSIRIFMDWQPLSAPISIPEPQITTPQRNGFTLVEWGGTLYK